MKCYCCKENQSGEEEFECPQCERTLYGTCASDCKVLYVCKGGYCEGGCKDDNCKQMDICKECEHNNNIDYKDNEATETIEWLEKENSRLHWQAYATKKFAEMVIALAVPNMTPKQLEELKELTMKHHEVCRNTGSR